MFKHDGSFMSVCVALGTHELDDERCRAVPNCESSDRNASSLGFIQCGMNRTIPSIVFVTLVAAALAACGEKPQRQVSEAPQARSSEDGHGELRDRTRHQGEADRMNY
jgi:hypothetical protein